MTISISPTVTERDSAPTASPGPRWQAVCRYDRLLPERGVAALLGDVQVALFRTHDGTVHAIGNIDPFSGAAVLSRGIVGDRAGVATVASPVYKQAFDLVTGRCLDDPDVAVPTYPVRVADGLLEVGLP
ncbi:nitrite reductase small subunit NirD [Pseudonocardia xinjiangensis]|uniref:nitrite reductase small subunit NirD n=1 Tax=Pseudonocardia xinjiangensis TaxID=75289 RepID=UPI003D89C07B